MEKREIIICILLAIITTNLIRVLPMTLIKGRISNVFLRSFLYYVPYVTLSVMTFPAILHATGSVWSGLAGFLTAAVLSYKGKGLIFVSLCSCAVVFLLELVLVGG